MKLIYVSDRKIRGSSDNGKNKCHKRSSIDDHKKNTRRFSTLKLA